MPGPARPGAAGLVPALSERKGAAMPGLSESDEDSSRPGGPPWNPQGAGAREGVASKAPRSERNALSGDGLWFGGDYNPEQWDAVTWEEDGKLMRRARVNTATVGVFSWSLLEPEEGRFEF